MGSRIEIFNEKYLGNLTSAKEQGFKNKIDNATDKVILESDKDKYLDKLVQEQSLEPVEVGFQHKTMDKLTEHGKSKLKVYYPVGGNLDLLKYRPKGVEQMEQEVWLNEQEEEFWLKFSIEDMTPEEVNQKLEDIDTNLRGHFTELKTQVQEFNRSLRDNAETYFAAEKEERLEEQDMLGEIDVPLRGREDTPDTVAISAPEEREPIEVAETSESTESSKKIPTLSEEGYEKILTAINDVGMGFERSPRMFADKTEEDLRDFILVLLEMNFVGSATGETFNKDGKTDMLLRYENDNVFIGECAIWKGKGVFQIED